MFLEQNLHVIPLFVLKKIQLAADRQGSEVLHRRAAKLRYDPGQTE